MSCSIPLVALRLSWKACRGDWTWCLIAANSWQYGPEAAAGLLPHSLEQEFLN